MDFVVPTFLAILFALLTATFFLMFMKKKGQQSQHGTFGEARKDLAVKEQLDELLLEIQQISRENIAKLDTKIRMLNQLVLDAEQKKKELEALTYGKTPAKAETPAAPDKPANPLHDKVYTLRDKGKSAAEISTETGRDIGEIELILGLRDVK